MTASDSICVVGLGYVGLPLAHAFAAKGVATSGYDVSEKRITELQNGHDRTNELTDEQLAAVNIEYSADPTVIAKADIVIVAVPTPIDDDNLPDLTILKAASTTVGKQLRSGQIVVYESTVYPGTTEDICGGILEAESGLTCGKDFFLGYSPERINPGDKLHTVDKIIKVVAGQDDATADRLCELYGHIITAGVHRATNIKVAEMAKAIENAQRDLNIAFVNEVAVMCNKMSIKTTDVLAAAGTKWNFLKFQPGLVGGHCIGVDPYYLVEKARQLSMDTHVITAGRAVNDGMGAYVAKQIYRALPKTSRPTVLVLGLTFKENVPDTRNSKVVDVVRTLEKLGCDVEVHDPFYNENDIRAMEFTPGALENGPYDGIALLVPHKEYTELSAGDLQKSLQSGGVLYDLKSVVSDNDWSNYVYLSL